MKSYKKYHGSDVRNRRLTWIFIIFFLLAVGLIRGERVALILAQTMLALMMVTYTYVRYIIHKIDIRRETISKATEGDVVSVYLEIESKFWFPIRWICVKDYFGAEIYCDRQHEYLITQFDLWCKRQSIQYLAKCAAGRGKYSIGPVEIIVTDPLGIWILSKNLPVVDEVLVLPAIVQLRSISRDGKQRLNFSGVRTSHKSGLSYDFCGTREYRSGDSLRYIHWPATARTSKLIIKEFQQITTSRITIFLDLYRKSLQGFRPTNLDYAIKIAGSVAKYAVDNSYEFRLMAEGEKSYHFDYGKSEAHLNWLLEEMAVMKPGGDQSLLELLEANIPLVSSGEEIVIIFSSHIGDPQHYLDILVLLQSRNVSVTAVFLVATSFKVLQEYDGIDSYLIESDLPQMCMARGIHVVIVEKGADIARCFEGAF
ncbi:DUF58 domain-containing protein [Candidatus Uabimicrobium sp. HlEnr_7]|uniref:DUF58 domain-containing protein n=1 Tax=Candidatus Uabimicrobium helgolandensis TaxID=3095367 RepID=UPI003555CB34